ncbi:MAG: VWA domain-containing protein [Thermodesulfobacteriota bacterium]
MNLADLTKRFYDLVAPDIPNEWDVEEVLEPYLKDDDDLCLEVLGCVPAIWPISNSLCYDFLRRVPDALKCIDQSRLSVWVGDILDRYELDGLKAAQRFMNDVENSCLSNRSAPGLLPLTEVDGRLLPFIRGIAGEELHIRPGRATFTDSETIFLPAQLSLFTAREDNLLLYKLTLAFQWAYMSSQTFTVKRSSCKDHNGESEELWLTSFFDSFEPGLLARDTYFFLETVRAWCFLERELPGLMRRAAELAWPLPQTDQDDPLAEQLRGLQRQLLRGDLKTGCTVPELDDFFSKQYGDGASALDSVNAVEKLCAAWLGVSGDYSGVRPLPFQGELRLKAIERVRQERLQRLGEDFAESLALHLASLSRDKLKKLYADEEQKQSGEGGLESDVTMIMDPEFAGTVMEEHGAPLLMTINNEELELPEELSSTAQQLINEYGHLPGRFISSAVGKAGDSVAPGGVTAENGHGQELPAAPFLYDEWDHRRQGFRKNWCQMNIKEIPPLKSGFIAQTLSKYHGLMIRLRHQFEMMRSHDRFVRRQRDGDDIDLDALVESLADTRAGLPPSDRLFVKLCRDERDIAVIFLVDMSNSTAGWVGTTIKESLVLMTEALEVLGDRYGIYGFSGMRRTRCELFRIKDLQEPSGEKVRERIGAISPREYTRMGPAIRHGAKLLAETDARVRLLITLTDGKPEDYDDYKGDYAIEDTRHALLEAKMAGIHPFCITIDHQAHDYMDHMYGPVNYIFVNDVRKLPMRMPEIYRTLTS